MRIFGIPLDNLSRTEILEQMRQFLDGSEPRRIATVNPEFLLRAARDATFHANLMTADLRVVDGSGIVLAGRLRGLRIRRFPGADLMEEILRIANERRLGVFLAVRSDGLSSYEEIRVTILKRYPDIQLLGKDVRVDEIGNCLPDGKAGKLEIGNSVVVLCNFGAPEQEYFLETLRRRNTSPRILMGVGGAFDYLTGKRKRAPGWLRARGLEWLWRLFLQPKRFIRIWNATAVFLWKVSLKRT